MHAPPIKAELPGLKATHHSPPLLSLSMLHHLSIQLIAPFAGIVPEQPTVHTRRGTRFRAPPLTPLVLGESPEPVDPPAPLHEPRRRPDSSPTPNPHRR